MRLRSKLLWVWIVSSVVWMAIIAFIVYEEREYLFRSCAPDQPPECKYGPLDTYVAFFALGAAAIPPVAVYLLGEVTALIWRVFARR